MKEILNCPIKYGLMPIGMQLQYKDIKIDQTIYIISKCYVISEVKNYLHTDQPYHYQVVFPYTVKNENIIQNIETFNIKSSINQLFDNIEEATNERNKKNIDNNNQLDNLLLKEEELNEMKEKNNQLINQCLEYEKDILSKTDNLKILNQNIKLENIIDSMFENPKYFYTKIAGYLSIYEKDYLSQFITDKNCINCNNITCKITNQEDKKECPNWNNNELIGRQKIKTK